MWAMNWGWEVWLLSISESTATLEAWEYAFHLSLGIKGPSVTPHSQEDVPRLPRLPISLLWAQARACLSPRPFPGPIGAGLCTAGIFFLGRVQIPTV